MTQPELTAEFERQLTPLLDALFSTAKSLCRCPADAEDLVQVAALKAYKGMKGFQPGTNFRAWIFRILLNTHWTQYRRSRLEPKLFDFSIVDPEDPRSEAVFLTLDDLERIREQIGDLASGALGRMPKEQRDVFMLSTFGELHYKEIAKALSIPLGTVMSRLFRARRMLRSCLRRADVEIGIST